MVIRQTLYFVLFVAALALAMGPVALLASDTTDATYLGRIEIRKNNTAITNAYVNFTLDTQELVSDGFIHANANNTAITGVAGADVAYMPAPNSTDEWIVWVPNIGENTTITNNLYTGGNETMAGKIRWFPTTSGASTTDAADLELANNFTVNVTGYINATAGTNMYLAYKQKAVKLYVSDAGTVTGAILGSQFQSANGHEGENWTAEGSSPANAYDDDVAYPGTPATFASNGPGPTGWGPFQVLNVTTMLADTVRYFVDRSHTYISQFDIDVHRDGSWIEVFSGVPSWGTWESRTFSEGNVDQVRFRVYKSSPGSVYGRMYEVDVQNVEAENITVTATGVSSADHAVNMTADTTNLSLYIDSVEQDSAALGGTSVPDNANDWSWATNSSLPYVESISLTINGTQELLYDFTAFTSEDTVSDTGDAPANTGSLTFAAAPSDSDLSATLASYLPVGQAQASSTVIGADPTLWETAPTNIPQLYTELQTNHLPGAGAINDLLSHANIPQALFWFPATFGAALILGFLAYAATRSLLMQAFVSGIVMAYASLMTGGGIIPFWVVILFVIEAVAILWTQRQRAAP